MKPAFVLSIVLRARAAATAAILCAALALPAAAQTVTTNEAVARIFREEIQAEWFAPTLLAQAPVEQIVAIVGLFTGQFGPLVAVEGTGAELTTVVVAPASPTVEASIPRSARDSVVISLFRAAMIPFSDG